MTNKSPELRKFSINVFFLWLQPWINYDFATFGVCEIAFFFGLTTISLLWFYQSFFYFGDIFTTCFCSGFSFYHFHCLFLQMTKWFAVDNASTFNQQINKHCIVYIVSLPVPRKLAFFRQIFGKLPRLLKLSFFIFII